MLSGGRVPERRPSDLPRATAVAAVASLALCSLAGFLLVMRAVVTTSALAAYDPQVAALLRAFRTPPLTRVLWAATVFGDPRSMWAVAAVFVLLLVVWGRRAEAVLVGVTMAAGSAIGDAAKVATHRPRPPASLAIIREPASASFPSGHALASLLLFALLAFVLWRTAGTTAMRRVAIAAVCALGAFLVALSRVYLGVHWPTDVLGGWCLAAALVTVTLSAYLAWERHAPGPKRWRPVATGRVRLGVALALACVALAVLIAGAAADPLLREPARPLSTRDSYKSFASVSPNASSRGIGSPRAR